MPEPENYETRCAFRPSFDLTFQLGIPMRGQSILEPLSALAGRRLGTWGFCAVLEPLLQYPAAGFGLSLRRFSFPAAFPDPLSGQIPIRVPVLLRQQQIQGRAPINQRASRLNRLKNPTSRVLCPKP